VNALVRVSLLPSKYLLVNLDGAVFEGEHVIVTSVVPGALAAEAVAQHWNFWRRFTLRRHRARADLHATHRPEGP
jgi:hypothetical protein